MSVLRVRLVPACLLSVAIRDTNASNYLNDACEVLTAYLQGITSGFFSENFISFMGANHSGLQNSTNALAFIAGIIAIFVVAKMLYTPDHWFSESNCGGKWAQYLNGHVNGLIGIFR